jgi:hypothetical protein
MSGEGKSANFQSKLIERILWWFILIMYLSCSKCQRSGKEEIGICRTSVDQQIPKDGIEHRSYQENSATDKGVPKNWGKWLLFFDVSEEEIKMVKHLGGKVPEENNIRCYQAPSNCKKIVI